MSIFIKWGKLHHSASCNKHSIQTHVKCLQGSHALRGKISQALWYWKENKEYQSKITFGHGNWRLPDSFGNLKHMNVKKSFLRRIISPKYKKLTFYESWIKAKVLHLASVIQAQSNAWQAVRKYQPASHDFKMTTSPVLHMKRHPSVGGYILLFSGYQTFFSSDTASSYCHMKTQEDDEHCLKVSAFKAYFRRTGWGSNSNSACGWAWPGLCGELLALAPGSGRQWQGAPCDANAYPRSACRKIRPLKEKGMWQ